MDTEGWVALLGFGGTMLLVMTGLLNFSVFVRQLKASREQLDTARRQLEHAQQQPEILLLQRAMAESSEHLQQLLARPHLRPYFYENRPWSPADEGTLDEVKLMAELFLNTFASSLIHAATFPQYPARTTEQTIRFHLDNSEVLRSYLLEAFDRFPISGLALLALKQGNRAGVEQELAQLVERAPDERERARRAALLQHVRSVDALDPVALTRHALARAT